MVIVDEDDNVHARCDLETTKLEDADFFGLYDPQSPHAHDVRKPVIYLYPEEETDVLKEERERQQKELEE